LPPPGADADRRNLDRTRLESQTKQFDGMFSVDRPPAPPGRRQQESHRCPASNTFALGTHLGFSHSPTRPEGGPRRIVQRIGGHGKAIAACSSAKHP
jgi:hypothetical protein